MYALNAVTRWIFSNNRRPLLIFLPLVCADLPGKKGSRASHLFESRDTLSVSAGSAGDIGI